MLKLSEECSDLAREYKGETFTLRELLARLGARGAAFFALILSLPFILWVAFPGLSLILGVLICMNGIQIAFKKGVWIPKILAKRRFSGDKLSKILKHAQKWIKRVEKVIRPRLTFLHKRPFFRVLSGLVIAITGLFLALPFPPGTNFTPAVGIALLTLGQLEDDGLFTLIGYAFFLVNVFLFVVLPYLGITLLVRAL